MLPEKKTKLKTKNRDSQDSADLMSFSEEEPCAHTPMVFPPRNIFPDLDVPDYCHFGSMRKNIHGEEPQSALLPD